MALARTRTRRTGDERGTRRHHGPGHRPLDAPTPTPPPAVARTPVALATEDEPILPGALQHQVVRTTLRRRELGALLASDYGHRPLAELGEDDVHLPDEDPAHLAEVAASVRRDGIRQPLLVRVTSTGERVLLDGHHRAVVVLREHLRVRVPVVLVHCPCTMGCAVTSSLLRTLQERAAADGWGA